MRIFSTLGKRRHQSWLYSGFNRRYTVDQRSTFAKLNICGRESDERGKTANALSYRVQKQGGAALCSKAFSDRETGQDCLGVSVIDVCC